MMTRIDAGQAPQREAESAIRIETQGHVSRRVELAGLLHGTAQGRGGGVRHLDAGQHARRRHAEIQVGQHLGRGRAIEAAQLLLGHVVRVEGGRPGAHIHHTPSLFGFEQLDDVGVGQDNRRLADVHNHADGGQGRRQILRMRWADGDWNGPDVQAAVESADQIQSGRIDEGHVIPAVDASAFHQGARHALRPLVELGARQRASRRSLGAQQGEEDVIGRALGAPLKDLGDVSIFVGRIGFVVTETQFAALGGR